MRQLLFKLFVSPIFEGVLNHCALKDRVDHRSLRHLRRELPAASLQRAIEAQYLQRVLRGKGGRKKRAFVPRNHAWALSDSEFLEISSSWVTHASARSFARNAHSLASSVLLSSLARLAALTRSLAHSLALTLVGQLNFYVRFSRCFESRSADRFGNDGFPETSLGR